jgi:regulator of RNase E activity RraA
MAVVLSHHINTEANPTIIERLNKSRPEKLADAFETLKIPGNIINSSVSGIHPARESSVLSGPAYTVVFANINDKRKAIGNHTRDYLDSVPKNVVIVIANEAGNAFSVWGEVLSHYAQHHHILGTITNGSTRDINEIKKQNYPVFSSGAASQHSTGHYKVVALQSVVTINGVKIKPGDYILATAAGIAVIDPKNINAVLTVAEKKQHAEEKINKLIDNGLTLLEIDKKMQ